MKLVDKIVLKNSLMVGSTIILCLLIILLSGCEDPEEAQRFNKNSLSDTPEVLGKINGVPVKRYHLKSPDNFYDQYLIIVGDRTTLNVMRNGGKTQVVDVQHTTIVEDPQPKELSPEVKKEIADIEYQIKSCEDVARRYRMAITNLLNQYGR